MSLLQIAIAADQLANTLVGGYADETLSARAWRLHAVSRGWRCARRVIDGLFFWQVNHCLSAYESERVKRHLPGEYSE